MREQLERYTPADAVQKQLRKDFLDRLDAGATRREDRPSHLTASGVVVDASRTRVLLVLHKKVHLWLQPGGHLEDGDTTLAQAALREAVEETGVPDLRLMSELPVHLDRHAGPCGAEHHLDVRFLLEAPDSALPVVSEESDDVAWFPLDALPRQCSPDLEAMLSAALRSPSS